MGVRESGATTEAFRDLQLNAWLKGVEEPDPIGALGITPWRPAIPPVLDELEPVVLRLVVLLAALLLPVLPALLADRLASVLQDAGRAVAIERLAEVLDLGRHRRNPRLLGRGREGGAGGLPRLGVTAGEAGEEAIERHLLDCAHCSAELERLLDLAGDVRALMRAGRVRAVLGQSFVRRLVDAGMRVREYRMDPGGSVECTVAPDDGGPRQAHIVLPIANVAEEEGTFVNRDGRAQRYAQAKPAPGMARPAWWVLGELGAAAGAGDAPASVTDARAQLGQAVEALR